MTGWIRARRLVCFDSLTWGWAKNQENLSKAVRELILREITTFKVGRPAHAKLYIPPAESVDMVSDRVNVKKEVFDV